MINKFSNIPLYSQLKDLIIEKIEKGIFKEDTKIPSEDEFCRLYEISRPTVRQAISELVNGGYLYKARGKGTYVAKPKYKISLNDYTGFTDSILESKVPGSRNIINICQIDSNQVPKLSDIFNFPGSHKSLFTKVEYLTVIDNEVFALNVSYLPMSLFPDIDSDIRNNKPSYEILKGKYALVPSKSSSTLEIVYTEQSETQFLKIQPGQPLIKIDNTLYSKSAQVVEYIVSKYRADKCKLTFNHSR